MREINAIINAYDKAKGASSPCILATVVHVEGSSYRRAGARMLVDENGRMTGAISGGCLEGDALRKALHALHQNQNKLVTYDTSDENDAVIGAQLGCNGRIQVLFEPIDLDQSDNPLELLKQAAHRNELMVVGTFFDLDRTKEQPGTQFSIDERLNLSGKIACEKLFSQIIIDAETIFNDRSSLFREYHLKEAKHYVFLEALMPPPTLVLVGAGNDAQILSQMADGLGWNITVTDGRPTHANSDRFISSCQVIVSKPEQVIENVPINDRTFFVLMTHNYQYDLSVLKVLLDENVIPYIGILGPKKKYQRMLDDLKSDGIELSDQQLSKIHAPVGLEIGAETPAEIGLSILAEIQAVRTGTPGSFLKVKEGPIHRKKNNEFKSITLG